MMDERKERLMLLGAEKLAEVLVELADMDHAAADAVDPGSLFFKLAGRA